MEVSCVVEEFGIFVFVGDYIMHVIYFDEIKN